MEKFPRKTKSSELTIIVAQTSLGCVERLMTHCWQRDMGRHLSQLMVHAAVHSRAVWWYSAG